MAYRLTAANTLKKEGKNMKEETKVYLNTWYFYNEGELGFGWMTTDQARELMEAHEGDTRFEEWFIADIDNYCGIDSHDLERRNIGQFLRDIDILEACPEWERAELIAVADYCNCSIEDAEIEKDKYIIYEDEEAFFESCDENIQEELDELGNLSCYFDFDAFHRDCLMDAIVCDNGVVLVR